MEGGKAAFVQGVGALPVSLRNVVLMSGDKVLERGEEIRLRVGQPISVVMPEGELRVGDEVVTPAHLEQVLEIASCASVHSVLEQIREGFLTIPGGHRIGFCGTVVMDGGRVKGLRELSSASVRIARQFSGIARPVVASLLEEGVLKNTLIAAPPGGGKTSLLRDLIRCISSGEGTRPMRVGVADERGELGAMCRGSPLFDLGPRTDVLYGCQKAQGLMMLLRGMNPQVLAMDEVSAPGDVEALTTAAGCGVVLLASIHANGLEDLMRRPVYRALLEEHIFYNLVTIRGRGRDRVYTTEVLR